MIILVGIFSVNQKSDTDELQESFRLLVYTCVIKCAVFYTIDFINGIRLWFFINC
jgi:hypothetical protein